MALLKRSTLLSLGMIAGVGFAAHAQTGVASLPPAATAAPPAVASPAAPSVALPGPNPGNAASGAMGRTQAAMTPSPTYVGPAPGSAPSAAGTHFDKSPDWDANTSMHPYTSTSSAGPRTN